MKKYEADQDTIILAVKLLSKAFRENDIPKLEAAIAMRSMLKQLADEGLDVQMERVTQA